MSNSSLSSSSSSSSSSSPSVAHTTNNKRKWPVVVVVLALALIGGGFTWMRLHASGIDTGLISGNGRIEATEIDVATKLPGRIQDIQVDEGDFVTAGQVLAHMQVQTLEAQRDEAEARKQQALSAVASAEAQVVARQSDYQSVLAQVTQRESELDAAQRRLQRSETLVSEGAASAQEVDDDRARVRSMQAVLGAARAQVAAAQAGVEAARTQVTGARSAVAAAQATVARVQVDIQDSALVAPRSGRVQYRIAQAGEVVGGGGKILNLVDLSDVYMTFFVPETSAGKLALGGEVRIVLDAAPQLVIPATISFVASTAQFTPKTVETASERQKLMFRVKAQIDRALLQKNLKLVKTGLPGVAWLKIDQKAEWPANLAVKVPQ